MGDGRRVGMTTARFEALWYAQAGLRQFVLIYPGVAIMILDSGVSAVGLATLFTIWSASAVLFEVPTGVLADRLSRRDLLVASGVVKGCAPLLWLAVPGFWGYAAGFVVWSLGSALRSGTAQAYLHDALTTQGRSREFERIYGREQAAATAGAALALAVGGWAAEDGFTLVLWFSAAAPWGAALLAAFLCEPDRHAEVHSQRFWGTLGAGVLELRHSRLVAVVVAALVLLPTVYEVVEEFVPPLLDSLTFSLTAVGLTYAGLFLVRSAALLGAHRLRGLSLPGVCGVLAAAGLLLTLLGSAGSITAVLVLAGFFALSGIGDVLLQSRLQAAIRGEARATLTSVAGLGQELVSLGFYMAIGAVAQTWNWAPAVAMMGVWLVLSALLFAGLARPLSRPAAGP